MTHRSTALPVVANAGHTPEGCQLDSPKSPGHMPPAEASVLPPQRSDREAGRVGRLFVSIVPISASSFWQEVYVGRERKRGWDSCQAFSPRGFRHGASRSRHACLLRSIIWLRQSFHNIWVGAARYIQFGPAKPCRGVV